MAILARCNGVLKKGRRRQETNRPFPACLSQSCVERDRQACDEDALSQERRNFDSYEPINIDLLFAPMELVSIFPTRLFMVICMMNVRRFAYGRGY
jgi:hypothetical protein